MALRAQHAGQFCPQSQVLKHTPAIVSALAAVEFESWHGPFSAVMPSCVHMIGSTRIPHFHESFGRLWRRTRHSMERPLISNGGGCFGALPHSPVPLVPPRPPNTGRWWSHKGGASCPNIACSGSNVACFIIIVPNFGRHWNTMGRGSRSINIQATCLHLELARLNAALCLIHLGRFQAGLGLLDSTPGIYEWIHWAQFARGLALAGLGLYQSARSELEIIDDDTIAFAKGGHREQLARKEARVVLAIIKRIFDKSLQTPTNPVECTSLLLDAILPIFKE